MKRLTCAILVTVLFISFIPTFTVVAGSASQTAQLRTVWENPFTLTTYHPDDEVNSTFYTVPQVIWDGSQYVDYILNSSDMSAGIGSVYIKVCSDHTVFCDPTQTEERIQSESWNVECYNASSLEWETDSPTDNNVCYLVNSSGIYFDRTTTLSSGATLDEWYWLRIGSELKISVTLQPAQAGEYRLVWLLDGVSATRAQWLTTAENISSQIVEDPSCTNVQFTDENGSSRTLVDWSDAIIFNDVAQKWETQFQELSMQRDALDNMSQATIVFANSSLDSGESMTVDPTITTLCTNANSGIIDMIGQTYPPNEPVVTTGGQYLGVGQFYTDGWYDTERTYLSFDTSAVPSLAYNMNVTLSLETEQTYSTVDFSVQVMGGNQPVYSGNLTILNETQPIYGNTLSSASWGTGAAIATTFDAVNYTVNTYINLAIPSNQINKTGSTQFELKSSRDGIDAPQQNQDEIVYFYSGLVSGCQPELQVSYCLDTITIGTSDPVTWFYRNASSTKVAIVLFGGWVNFTSIGVRCVDWMDYPDLGTDNYSPEKSFGKIEFLDALVENGFSVYTPSNDSINGWGYWYTTDYYNYSTWVQDITMYLTCNQTYTQVYLFGFSGGAVVVGNEIQKDYASRFSAAVMNCAPVDWSFSGSGQIYQSALTASNDKVATFFPENINDPFYSDETEYYNNTLVQKSWLDWMGGHGAFFDPNETALGSPGENNSVAVINWFNAYHPPTTPFTPTGSQSDYAGTSYSYSTGTVDPNGLNVSYVFNWGDGTNSTTGYSPSGTNVTCSHAWSNVGSYNVTALAQDSQNSSCWSPPLTVNVISKGGGCPYVYDWNGTTYVKDNNILPASENGNGTDTKDYYLLQQPLVPVFSTKRSSVYSLQIGEFESNIDYINQVKLIAVDHSQGTSVAVTQDGEVFAYNKLVSPVSCVDNFGNSELTEISTMNGNVSDPATFYQGNKGDWLLLDFGRVTGPYANLVLRDDEKCSECIDVQVPNATGGWQTVDVLNPRDYWSIEAVNMSAYLPASGDFIVRLFWTQSHRLDYVGLDTSAPAPAQQISAPPTLAIHSTLGDVTQKLLYDDEQCVELINGQHITIWFALPSLGQGTTRSFILYTDGYYYTVT